MSKTAASHRMRQYHDRENGCRFGGQRWFPPLRVHRSATDTQLSYKLDTDTMELPSKESLMTEYEAIFPQFYENSFTWRKMIVEPWFVGSAPSAFDSALGLGSSSGGQLVLPAHERHTVHMVRNGGWNTRTSDEMLIENSQGLEIL